MDINFWLIIHCVSSCSNSRSVIRIATAIVASGRAAVGSRQKVQRDERSDRPCSIFSPNKKKKNPGFSKYCEFPRIFKKQKNILVWTLWRPHVGTDVINWRPWLLGTPIFTNFQFKSNTISSWILQSKNYEVCRKMDNESFKNLFFAQYFSNSR